MLAAAVGDASGLRGLGLGLGMKFRSFNVPTMLRKKGVLRARKKCAIAVSTGFNFKKNGEYGVN